MQSKALRALKRAISTESKMYSAERAAEVAEKAFERLLAGAALKIAREMRGEKTEYRITKPILAESDPERRHARFEVLLRGMAAGSPCDPGPFLTSLYEGDQGTESPAAKEVLRTFGERIKAELAIPSFTVKISLQSDQ